MMFGFALSRFVAGVIAVSAALLLVSCSPQGSTTTPTANVTVTKTLRTIPAKSSLTLTLTGVGKSCGFSCSWVQWGLGA